ncbi:MAG: tetratricopeptide repeat protein, partial [Desulfobacterales bacterium]
GNALFLDGQYDRAIVFLNKAIEKNPSFAEAYYNRGITYLEKKQFDKAISDFTKAIEINPRYQAFLIG